MKFTIATSVLAAIPLASAHYTFGGLMHNGAIVGKDWQYVREHTRSYMPTFKEEAATSNDFRCNKDAGSGNKTDVYTVKPGDKLALRQAFDPSGMKHPGPAQVYVSRAPGSVKEYDGAGDWLKVHQSLLCKDPLVATDLQNNGWCMYGENNIEFEVPETLIDGEYLVRAEHIAIHGAHDGKAEFYYACAQIRIQGSNATAMPTGAETTKIPGVYKTTDAAINFSVWAGKTAYPYTPGIAVAPGGTIRGSADGKSKAIVKVDAVGSDASPAASGSAAAVVASSSSSSSATAAASTAAATAPASTLATSVIATPTTAAAVATSASASSTAPVSEAKPTESAGAGCKEGSRGRHHRFRGATRA
ncbi:hypothetical protein MCOR25_006370 [Pyricularia grisea]|uniref:lytic cellulose monooxygenase (C4-dehydrogenating) n=1 Tax=Pyricularia grisea TaxID=148305 RepID=A0A6P8AQZ4_PYRGI|nr:uncharacterized protein PgNI_12044 [Pyricularia grisea]KAI6361804.1 hypothetical protein MCOR25_006370 [Pyricularia grisea]TLD04482.1 hypothetical protein PgNI_12044 [Pyricularia grisea]